MCLRWLVTHPLYVITEPLQRPERSYNFGNGDLTIYAATTNRDGSPLTVVMWPPLIWVLAMAVLASYLAILSGCGGTGRGGWSWCSPSSGHWPCWWRGTAMARR